MNAVNPDAVSQIVSAVSAGAAAGAKATAALVVKDSYAALKTLITGRYGKGGVTALEEKPESAAKRESLDEDLRSAGAGTDGELLEAAQRVLAVVAEHDPEIGQVVGLDIAGLSAVNVRVSDISAAGDGAVGVRARDVVASGDFEASRIQATDRTRPPDPPAR